MLLLLLIGASVSTPTPPDDLPYQGDTTIYDQASATGSISGGTVIDSEYIYD